MHPMLAKNLRSHVGFCRSATEIGIPYGPASSYLSRLEYWSGTRTDPELRKRRTAWLVPVRE